MTHNEKIPNYHDNDDVMQIVAQSLDVPQLDSGLSFLEAGGDSLAAVKLAVTLSAKYSEIPGRALLDKLLEAPSLVAFSRWVHEYTPDRTAPDMSPKAQVATVESHRCPPLLPEQSWFLAEARSALAHPEHWNDSKLLRFVPNVRVEEERVESAWKTVYGRHEALRLSLSSSSSTWVQHIAPAEHATLRVMHLANKDDLDSAVLDAEGSLSLTGGPLARAVLFRIEGEGDFLLLAAHHLAADEVSMEIVRSELESVYAGDVRSLRPAPSYSAYCESLRSLATDPAYLQTEAEFWFSHDWEEMRTVHQRVNVSHDSEFVPDDASSPVVLPITYPPEIPARSEGVLAAIFAGSSRWLGGPIAIQVVHNGRTPAPSDRVSSVGVVGRIAMVGTYPISVSERATPQQAVLEAARQMARIPRRGLGMTLLRWMGPEEMRERVATQMSPRLSGISVNFFGRAHPSGSTAVTTEIRHTTKHHPGNQPVHDIEIVGGLDQRGLTLHSFATPSVPYAHLQGLAEEIERCLNAV